MSPGVSFKHSVRDMPCVLLFSVRNDETCSASWKTMGPGIMPRCVLARGCEFARQASHSWANRGCHLEASVKKLYNLLGDMCKRAMSCARTEGGTGRKSAGRLCACSAHRLARRLHVQQHRLISAGSWAIMGQQS